MPTLGIERNRDNGVGAVWGGAKLSLSISLAGSAEHQRFGEKDGFNTVGPYASRTVFKIHSKVFLSVHQNRLASAATEPGCEMVLPPRRIQPGVPGWCFERIVRQSG